MPIGQVAFVNHCDIAAPRELCFRYISDFTHDPEWWLPVTSSQRICGQGLGAIYEQVASVGVLHFSSLIEITAYHPEQSMAFTITSHGVMHCQVQYDFSDHGGITTFTISSTISFLPMWIRLIAPIFKGLLIQQVTSHFAILKQQIEMLAAVEA